MSIEVISLILNRKVGGATRKAILIALGNYASPEGRDIFPSKATLAAQAEVHKDTVKNHIRDLVEDGVLRKVGRRKVSNGFTTVYDMDLKKLSEYPKATGGRDHPVIEYYIEGEEEITPEEEVGDTPNRPKPSENRQPPNPQGNIDEVFEKLWKRVLDITPDSIKTRHVKKYALRKFKSIVTRKKNPIAATRIANAVLWFYDSPEQTKEDRAYMKGLGPLLNGEGFAMFLEKGQFNQMSVEDEELATWQIRANYFNENSGDWPPNWPSARSMPKKYRDLFDRNYWDLLGWLPKDDKSS